MKTSMVTPYVFAALVVILLANGGLTTTLGAHPFWSVQVAWIGTPVGLVLALAAKHGGVRWSLRSLVFLILAILAFALAAHGKSLFAASFAEDRAAGRLWYFGWIATACFAAAFLAALFSPTRQK